MESSTYLFPLKQSSYTVKSLHEDLFYIPKKSDFRNHRYKIFKPNIASKNILATKESCEMSKGDTSDDDNELSGKSKIWIPSFSKHNSPFKNLKRGK